MEITFKQGNKTHRGTVTTIEKNNEFHYTLNLLHQPLFTIHINDDGYWETDNPSIDPELVMYTGNAIENMEDLEDVLIELDTLKS